MTTVALRAAIVLTVAGFVLAAAGAVSAASPEPEATVGGRLSTAGKPEVIVLNQGTLPVRVTMSAEVVVVDSKPFVLNPGEERAVPFTGEATGHVWANIVGIRPDSQGDANSVNLGLELKPYSPPFDPAPWGIATLILASLALIARRLKPWRWRIVTTPAA